MIVFLSARVTNLLADIESAIGEKITECHNREESLKVLPEADILITLGGSTFFDEELLAAAPKLKLVLSMSAGVEKLPLRALHARDIAVCNMKGAFSATIAEYVLGGMIAMSHRFPAMIQNQSRASWKTMFSGEDLEGHTLAVIGAGSIGSEIARRAKAFDMTILGFRRHPAPTEHFDEVLGIDTLTAALPRADYIVLATPLTNETYRLLGAAEFAAMKKTAVFINISRGDTVDEAALLTALREKQIAGAVLDVFQNEPLSPDSPFWALDNVLVTPHSSGLSAGSGRKTREILCANIARFRNGEPLINRIKKDALY